MLSHTEFQINGAFVTYVPSSVSEDTVHTRLQQHSINDRRKSSCPSKNTDKK